MAVLRGRFRGGVGDHLERLFRSGTSTGLTEGQLLDRFASGRDETAFVALVERHGPMVLGVCRRFLRDPNDVDDAFQATFLVLVRKAGTLRRKELLGNWLYGVACRVSRRARCAASRRSSRFTTVQDLEPVAADWCHTRGGVVATSLRDGEGPLLHEEVSRLPSKYRTPIVLCYFEGLTHDQAAARLGWPVGTVKGRLARARELLRSRLSRRGLAISTAALAAELASSDARASVPAGLIQSTLKSSLAVLSGTAAALPASSAVPLTVTSLTEGVLHAMVLSQVKSIAIPVLLAMGLLATGVSVVAYQPVPASRGRAGQVAAERTSHPGAFANSPPADQADPSGLQTARVTLDNLRKLYSQGTEGLVIDVAQYNNWSLNLLFGEMLADPSEAGLVKAFEGHRDRLAELLKDLTPLGEGGKVSKAVTRDLTGYLDRAERMLGQFRKPQDGDTTEMMAMMGRGMGGTGGGMGGMGGMGGGMMRQMMMGRAMGGRGMGGAMGGGMGSMSGRGGGMGGAMGGRGGMMGGGDTAGGADLDGDPRIEIARMAASISTLDRSPRNQAVLEKLDEPITLHFAAQTPLSEVLKHIREHFKGPDGKKLPIYVDPLGLQEAEKTEKSPVTIDLEDIPLKLSLRLLLKQLNLAYCIRDGVVIISSVEGIQQELKEAQSEQKILQEFSRSQ
jgi:RNA polymerase sigma factor (sigma-70 family)